MSARELWQHIATHWDDYVLPDLTRVYGLDTTDEQALLARPWWWLRVHLLALFGYRESIIGATFERSENEQFG